MTNQRRTLMSTLWQAIRLTHCSWGLLLVVLLTPALSVAFWQWLASGPILGFARVSGWVTSLLVLYPCTTLFLARVRAAREDQPILAWRAALQRYLPGVMVIGLLQGAAMYSVTRLLVNASKGASAAWMSWIPWIDMGASTVVTVFVYVLPLIFLFSLDLSLLRLFPVSLRCFGSEWRFVLLALMLEVALLAVEFLAVLPVESLLDWLLRDSDWLDVGTSGAIMGSVMSITTVTLAQYLLWVGLALLILWHGERGKT